MPCSNRAKTRTRYKSLYWYKIYLKQYVSKVFAAGKNMAMISNKNPGSLLTG
jgi:hypothetical protein